jgi:hypothetical protein
MLLSSARSDSHHFARSLVFCGVASIRANRCGTRWLLTAHKCAHSFLAGR